MQFFTIRERRSGTERHARPAGPRGEFFAFDYEVIHDWTIEGVTVQLGSDVQKDASWEYGADIHAGARIGWEDARHDDGLRMCCTKLILRTTREHPVDTSPYVVRLLLREVVRRRLVEWAEPIPRFHHDWLTSDVLVLARGIHADGAFDRLPILCDALQDAGCADPLVIDHLQTCPDHTPSCWVVEMILDQAAARG